MGGYSCQRKSRLAIYNQVYGKLQIPTYYAGICPLDDNGNPDWEKNVLPEMFFGFYASDNWHGLDIGLRMVNGGKWAACTYRSSEVCGSMPNWNTDSRTLNISAGEILYAKAWIGKEGTKYYSYFNVSRNSYGGTDLLSTPYKYEITATFGEKMDNGYYVNREIAIAANPTSYETSGAYLISGKWMACGLVTPNNVTYVWTDDNSYDWPNDPNEYFVAGTGGRKILRLRKDNGTVNTNRIKLGGRTDSSSGATETASIDFKSTPTI